MKSYAPITGESLLDSSEVVSEVQDGHRHRIEGGKFYRASGNQFWMRKPVLYSIYALALAVSIAIWFIAIHAPLRQDETGTWWLIKDGFSQIWLNRFIALGFPSYSYILWLSTKIIGTSEIALRIPSILAMLGAVWLLYLAARELFSRELAILAAVIFCLHPIVIFESIDIRPYAFAVLATNAAILILLRLRRSDSNWLAALFGLLAAVIVSFHYLFATILPALLVCFFLVKAKDRKTLWRQAGIALAVFALAFLPMVPGLEFLFRTSGAHVYEAPPQLGDLIVTLAPGLLPFVFCGAALLAGLLAAFRPSTHASLDRNQGWRIPVCLCLALIPVLILYGISVATPIHMFRFSHRLAAIPGLALCWALLIERYLKGAMRPTFCVVLVAATAFQIFRSPDAKQHFFTRKYALEAAERNASVDNAPVLVCSGFVESRYVAMPLDSPKTSRYFAPLSYYKLTVPVVPLPWGLNDEAKRVGSQFLKEATQKHQRFLAVASDPSYDTLDWLSKQASPNYNVHSLGTFDTVKVFEFDPRTPATPPVARSSGPPPPRAAKAASRPATP